MERREYRPQPFEAQPDDRGTQNIYGDPNKPASEMTPKDWRALLAIRFGDHYVGTVIRRNEDDSRTSVRAYHFTIEENEDNYAERERIYHGIYGTKYAKQIIPIAMEAGYELAARPIRVNNSEKGGIYLDEDRKPAYELWLLFQEREGIDMQKPTGESPLDYAPAIETFKDPFVTQRGAIEGIEGHDYIGFLSRLLNTPSYETSLGIPQATVPTDQAEPNSQA